MRTFATAVCAGTLSAASLFAQGAEALTAAETFKTSDGETLKYRLHMPEALAAGAKVPLILFLHGAGERGDDNARQLKHGVADLIRFSQTNGQAVVLAPQCPTGQQWVNVNWNALSHSMPSMPSAPMKLALLLLQEKLASLPVDPSRIYVTGISMGGYGAWDIVQRKPELFAAAIPICGGGDTRLATEIKRVPLWVFHGDQDGAVPVSRSRDMVNALKASDANVQYREYPGAGHDVWTRTYADTTVLTWLFAQRKTRP
jgi:predicted peptidase